MFLNGCRCTKGNLIHLKISTDLVFFFDSNILFVLPEIYECMKEYLDKCDKVYIFICG